MTQSRRTAPRIAPAIAAVTLLILAACTGGRTGATEPYATLIIRNDATATVTIYALRGGSRQRLGTVRGLATEELRIRRTMLGGGNELDLLVDPVGSPQTYRAHRIYINEGDVVELAVSSLVR